MLSTIISLKNNVYKEISIEFNYYFWWFRIENYKDKERKIRWYDRWSCILYTLRICNQFIGSLVITGPLSYLKFNIFYLFFLIFIVIYEIEIRYMYLNC